METILRFFKISLVTAIGLFAVSCMNNNGSLLNKKVTGSGKTTVEKREVQGTFDKIRATNGIEVKVEQAEDYEIVVEADDNIMPYLRTEIKGGTLEIYFDKVSIINYKEAKVEVKTPQIRKLKVSASAEIIVQNKIKTTDLIIDASSAAEVEIGRLEVLEKVEINSSSTAEISIENIKAKGVEVASTSSSDVEIDKVYTETFKAKVASSADLDIEYIESNKIDLIASSSSRIELKGKTAELSAQTSSVATINAKELMANNATVSASSSSEVMVYPVASLKAEASSASGIYYYNEPETLVKDTSSAASVERK